MPTICRLIQLTPAEGDALLAQPDRLKDRVAAAKVHSDVYRYWHGIQFLLGRHRPDTPAAQWLELGSPVRNGDPSLPDDRLIMPTDVAALNAALSDVAPDDLAPHYDAGAMDAANVYPVTWQVWEEDFDPLGQILEHHFFLQQFVARCAEAQAALLLHFDVLAEGSV
jgi:hypothetical protein